MIFRWFDANEAKAFGTELARDLLHYEKSGINKGAKKTKQKTPEALASIFGKIALFNQNNKLNFYKKAQLGNAFKWTLIEGGYTQEEANKMTTALLIKLQK